MATIPELLDGHVTLEIECLDRLYLNGYIGKLATGPGLVMFMRGQLGKPVPSPVVFGQVSKKFREAVKTQADREQVPINQFRHKERKDDIANDFGPPVVPQDATSVSGRLRYRGGLPAVSGIMPLAGGICLPSMWAYQSI